MKNIKIFVFVLVMFGLLLPASGFAKVNWNNKLVYKKALEQYEGYLVSKDFSPRVVKKKLRKMTRKLKNKRQAKRYYRLLKKWTKPKTKPKTKPVVAPEPEPVVEEPEEPIVESEPTPEPEPVEEPVVVQPSSNYAWHENIMTTYFWVGEGASSDNGYISNYHSAWDENWVEHFGGMDDPYNRNGYLPAGFTPQENTFYVAIPYTDFSRSGRKDNVVNIPWYDAELAEQDNYSFIKNRWVEIENQAGQKAYAQIEDAGPYESDDFAYVFEGAELKNTTGNKSGLDVSPAVRDYLGFDGLDIAKWRFVEANDVPSGPWTNKITTSDCYWE